MRRRRSFQLLCLLFTLALVASACSKDKKTTTTGSGSSLSSGQSATKAFTRAQGKPGGSATMAVEQEYTAYNNQTGDTVLTANNWVLSTVEPQVFLTAPNFDELLNTDLMDSVTITSTNPQTIVWKVKPNAVWSDGVPIDCKDFYLEWLSSNGVAKSTTQTDDSGKPAPAFNAASTTGYEDISALTCADNNKTITTTFSKPFADYEGLFSGTNPLLPAHVLEQQTGIADITTVTPTSPDVQKAADFWNTGWNGFNAATMPSGAWYTITSWNQGQDLTISRNEKYYGAPGYLDKIVFKLVPDPTQEPSALGNNDVQVISPLSPGADTVAEVSQLPNVSFTVGFGTTFEHLDFNFKNPLFQDLAVRQAFALCLDTQEIVNKEVAPLSDKASVLGNRMLMTTQAGYVDNRSAGAVDLSTSDPDQAKQILQQDGWTMGADGVATKNGQRLSFAIGRRDPSPRRHDIIQLAQQQCKPAGFDISEAPDPEFNSKLLPAGTWDMALFGWQGTPQLSSNEPIYSPNGGENFGSYNSPEVGTLFTQLDQEFDGQKKIDLANQIDSQIWKDVATIPLFQDPEVVAWRNEVKNVVYNGPQGVTWNAYDWSLG